MITEQQKEKILEFMKQVPLGVLATVAANGKPQAALVGISENENLELYFGTSNLSRKYGNVTTNPWVAVTFWGEALKTTLQYEGVAAEVHGEERTRVETIHSAKNPNAKKFATDTTQTYFKITPTWIRYTHHSGKPEDVFEINF